jgi:hypothetical protein
LLAFIFWQRRQHTKLRESRILAELAGSSGVAELGGAGIGGAAVGDKKDAKRMSDLHGGRGNVSPISPKAAEKPPLPPKGAEMAAPLSVEEKQELERRRRAAELSGAGGEILVEAGEGERGELEARRRFYELA